MTLCKKQLHKVRYRYWYGTGTGTAVSNHFRKIVPYVHQYDGRHPRAGHSFAEEQTSCCCRWKYLKLRSMLRTLYHLHLVCELHFISYLPPIEGCGTIWHTRWAFPAMKSPSKSLPRGSRRISCRRHATCCTLTKGDGSPWKPFTWRCMIRKSKISW